MALMDCHGMGRSYINAIPYDFSSPRVSILFCIMLRHKAIGLNGDLAALMETNFRWTVVVSKRLKANGGAELSK